MNRMRVPGRARERKLNRILMVAFALVLFIGVVAQIAMLAQLSIQNKQTVAAEAEAYDLTNRIGNLELSLSQHHDLHRITARAQQLGMQMPDESQLRVLNLPGLADSTTAQSADNSKAGAEELQ